MTDFDIIWRTQDEIRTVVDAFGYGVWDIRYNPKRQAIELELMANIDEDAVSNLGCQFPVPCDYDGTDSRGSKFVSTCKIFA